MAVITGLGAVSSLGHGAARLAHALELGQHGIRRIRRFPTSGFGVHIAGLVPSHNEPRFGAVSSAELCQELALAAAREACADAGFSIGEAQGRLALVFGTSGTNEIPVFQLTEGLASRLGVRGPCISVSTACASSTNALGIALDLLRGGMVDSVLAGGADVLTPLLFAGFHALGVLSVEPCAPFSERLGTSLGEGAGFLLLEKREHACARGARLRGVLAGYGLSADAHHETSPDPTGRGVARAIQSALLHAGLDASQVGYVNAHATGTASNDPAEWRALVRVFGERAQRLPVSGSKSVLGHAQAAAGVLEAIVTLVSMERGVVPQTLGVGALRANAPPDAVAQSTPRPHVYTHAVSTNSAFGGANAALVLSSMGEAGPPARLGLRPVYVAGIGRAEAAQALDADCPDPSTQQLKSATLAAFADAGMAPPRGGAQEQSGLVLGINAVSPASIAALRASIDARGLPHLSAHAFSRMVLNAPAGTCTKALRLRGPQSSLSAGPASGILALIYAVELLATREDVSLMVAAGVHESSVEECTRAPTTRQGAAASVLARSVPSAREHARRVGCERSYERWIEVAGWAIAGPGETARACSSALEQAQLPADGVERRFEAEPALGGEHEANGLASADACLQAIEFLRQGRARTALVVSSLGRSLCCAVAFVVQNRRPSV